VRTDRDSNSREQYHTKGSRKDIKVKDFICGSTRMWDVKCMVMSVITAAIWNSNKRYEKTFGKRRRKAFIISRKRSSYARNITHNTERTAV